MNLTLDQQILLQKMLGKATITFERSGCFFTGERVSELDELVDLGALRREESVEAWGECITYRVTDKAKDLMARI